MSENIYSAAMFFAMAIFYAVTGWPLTPWSAVAWGLGQITVAMLWQFRRRA